MNSVQAIWKSNQIPVLLGTGLLTVVLFCASWYFNWLPDISFAGPSLMADPQLTQGNKLPVLVTTVISPRDMPSEQVAARIHLYPPATSGPEYGSPIRTDEVLMGSSEIRSAAFVGLPPGLYTVIAFLDYNGNEILDLDESGRSAEPFLVWSAPPTQENQEGSPVVELQSGVTTDIVFRFDRQRRQGG